MMNAESTPNQALSKFLIFDIRQITLDFERTEVLVRNYKFTGGLDMHDESNSTNGSFPLSVGTVLGFVGVIVGIFSFNYGVLLISGGLILVLLGSALRISYAIAYQLYSALLSQQPTSTESIVPVPTILYFDLQFDAPATWEVVTLARKHIMDGTTPGLVSASLRKPTMARVHLHIGLDSKTWTETPNQVAQAINKVFSECNLTCIDWIRVEN
jgi:hypothetical protein